MFPTAWAAASALSLLPSSDPADAEPTDGSGAPSIGATEWRLLDLFDFSSDDALGEGVVVRVGGRLAFDLAGYGSDNAKHGGLSHPIDRPLLEGDVYGTTFRLEFDAVDVDSDRRTFDFWVARELTDHFRLQAGQIRLAMASEYATREENFPLVGHGFTSYLTGRYDLGVRAEAGFLGDALGLEAAATTGNGFGLEGESKSDPLLLLRGTVQPFRHSDVAALRGFFLGGSIAHQSDFSDELRVATPLQSVVFVTPDLEADRARWAALEAGWHHGPFRVGFEHVWGMLDDVELPGGGAQDFDELRAWTLYGSVFLMGGEPEWRRGAWRMPSWEPDARPLELAARYTQGNFDRDFFRTGLAQPGLATDEARSFGLELAWYPLAGTRVALGWVHTITDDDLATFGGGRRDSSFLLRLEFDF